MFKACVDCADADVEAEAELWLGGVDVVEDSATEDADSMSIAGVCCCRFV